MAIKWILRNYHRDLTMRRHNNNLLQQQHVSGLNNLEISKGFPQIEDIRLEEILHHQFGMVETL